MSAAQEGTTIQALNGASPRQRHRLLLREVNARIRGVGERLAVNGGGLELVCECAGTDCVAKVELPLTEYERIRSDPQLFLVAAGHDHETPVVEDWGRLLVVSG
jgi:hypothetical protein